MGFCYVCDRCGKLIPSTVYTVSIGAQSVNGGNNLESAAFNLGQNLSPTKRYCGDCTRGMMEFLRPVKEANAGAEQVSELRRDPETSEEEKQVSL